MHDLKTQRLEQLVNEVTQKVTTRKDPSRPYIGLEHMVSCSPHLTGASPSHESISTNNVFVAGDTLFGKLRPNLRKVVIAPFPGYCSTDILVFRPVDGVESRFVGRLFQSERVHAVAVRTSIGTKMPRTSWSELKSLVVPTPPLPEQQKIAEVLDTVDEAIARTEAIIAKLKQMKQGLLHDLLTRGIDDNGELRDPICHPEQFKPSPLGPIPKAWKLPEIGSLRIKLIDGDRGPEYPNAGDLGTTGYCLFLSAENVTRDGFRFNDTIFISRRKDSLLRKGRLEREDIVVTTRGTLGNFAYFDAETPFNIIRINSGMVIIRNRGTDIQTPYLYEILRSPLVQKQIALGAYGSAQPQVNLHLLSRLRIVLPDLGEQDRILARIRTSFGRLAQEQRLYAKLRLLKQGLMEDLLTGRVRVTNLLGVGSA